MTDESVLEVERDGDVATLRLNRPKQFNALNRELLERLGEVTSQLAHDGGVRAVVMTGAGKAFCAGGDLSAMQGEEAGETSRRVSRLAGAFHEAIIDIRTMDKAVIAAVNGPAVGGGFSLALACDLRVVASTAYLKVAYTANGLAMDGGGSWSLPRLGGRGRATRLAFLDEEITPERAVELGLAARVVEPGDLAQTVGELADRMAGMPVETIGRTKRRFNRAFDNSLERHLEEERRAIAASATSPEGQEGIEAFLEKREPDYRGADSGE